MDYLVESENLARFVIERCVGRDGMLCDKINLKNGICSDRPLTSDLGDYVPFFYWLGEVGKSTEFKNFASNQVKTAEKVAMVENGLFYTYLGNSHFKIFSANDMADSIVGVVLMYELTGDDHFKMVADKFYNGLSKSLLGPDGFISAYKSPILKSPFSVSGYSGVYIEELARLYRLTGEEKYLNHASELAKPWISEKRFTEYGLFFFHPTSRLFRFFELILKATASSSFDTAIMMKPNTNMIYGLLELYRVGKDDYVREAISKWLSNLRRLKAGEFYYSNYNCKTNVANTINLETNATILDILIEAYIVLNDKKLLDAAKKNADEWLSLQTSSGLVPNSPEDVTNYHSFKGVFPVIHEMPGRYARLDPQVDLSVGLFKLSELTGDEKYQKAAIDIIEGILKYHKFEESYVEFVDTQTLEKKGFEIETKFLALLLKAYLLAFEVQKGKEIFKDEKILSLIRDR
jgi:uncharacterized protein YyaL (SSP411 family)